MTKRLRIPVLEPDGRGGARIRTEAKPAQPRRPRTPDEERRRRTAEPWRGSGYGHAYRTERQRCIEEARGRCKDCGRVVARRNRDGTWSCTVGQTHHEEPLRDGGKGRLVLLCPSCHARREALLRRSRGR